jgi:hypothetical protein
MRRVLFALLVLAASGAACATPPPPPLWSESVERTAWRATVAADAAVAAAAAEFSTPPPTTTKNKETRELGIKFATPLTTSVEDSPGLLDVVATAARRNGTSTGYRQSLMSALSGCVVDVAKLRLEAGAFEASCMGVGFFFPKAVRSLGTPFSRRRLGNGKASKKKNRTPHFFTSRRGGATMLGLATFHNVISQSKHQLTTTSMFFVTNPTPPRSGGNPTRGRTSTSKRSVICTNTGNDKSGVNTCTSTVELFAGVS